MLFRRIKSEGLAHNSYYVGDGPEAIVVDPRRDADVYLDLARENQQRITAVLETHRNEDYAIGSTALAEQTGATILHGPNLDWGYGEVARDGDEVGAGRLRFRVLETPGHTLESLSYALVDTDTADDPVVVFTGDALFVGDTGRTDLLGDDRRRELSGKLYDSLHAKILPLGDGVVLAPAHGGGSVCGGAISDRDESSLGFERLHSPKLAGKGKEAFVRDKIREQHLQPPYFRRMEEWNQKGNAPVHLRVPTPPLLSPGELEERRQDGAILVDARMPQAFAGGHVPGSYNIWLGGISAYLGWIVPHRKPLVLVLPEGTDLERVMRILLRIGYDEVAGVLRGGFESWQNSGREVAHHETIDTATLRERLRRSNGVEIVDVRKPDEWAEGTIEGARTIFVGDLEKKIGELPKDTLLVSMCTVGHRGGLGASILARHGLRTANYLGGYTAWKQTGEQRS